MTDTRPEGWWLLLDELRAKADAEDPARRVVTTQPVHIVASDKTRRLAEQAKRVVAREARDAAE